MIKRDSHNSFAAQVHAAARSVANPQQQKHLDAEVQRQKIRTNRTY